MLRGGSSLGSGAAQRGALVPWEGRPAPAPLLAPQPLVRLSRQTGAVRERRGTETAWIEACLGGVEGGWWGPSSKRFANGEGGGWGEVFGFLLVWGLVSKGTR